MHMNSELFRLKCFFSSHLSLNHVNMYSIGLTALLLLIPFYNLVFSTIIPETLSLLTLPFLHFNIQSFLFPFRLLPSCYFHMHPFISLSTTSKLLLALLSIQQNLCLLCFPCNETSLQLCHFLFWLFHTTYISLSLSDKVVWPYYIISLNF